MTSSEGFVCSLRAAEGVVASEQSSAAVQLIDCDADGRKTSAEDPGRCLKRVLCPMDSKHSVYDDRMLRHLYKCTWVRDKCYEMSLPFVIENCNSTDSSSSSTTAASSSTTAASSSTTAASSSTTAASSSTTAASSSTTAA
eukprot:Lankesteria_metandrocarpae@DN5885_c0_g1_i1.p1